MTTTTITQVTTLVTSIITQHPISITPPVMTYVPSDTQQNDHRNTHQDSHYDTCHNTQIQEPHLCKINVWVKLLFLGEVLK